MEERQFNSEERKYIEDNSNVEIVWRIKSIRKDSYYSKPSQLNSVKSVSRRSRSRGKRFNKTVTSSGIKTPRNSSIKNKKATTPKARKAEPKCSIFACKDKRNTVFASENAISSKIIEGSMINTQELDYFSNALFSGAQMFEFDKVLAGDKNNNK